MKKHSGIIVVVVVVAISVFSAPMLHAQRIGPVARIDADLTPAQGHLVGLKIDPDSGTVWVFSKGNLALINSSFSFVSATCLNCGAGCPSFSRSIDVVLEATTAVAGGYGVSSLTSVNSTVTNVAYSTEAALTAGQQVTITITGNVLSCSSWFKVYFDMCDSSPSNWSNSCPVSSGPVGVLNTNAAVDSGDDYYPQVTTDGNGNWVAVWQSKENLSGTIGTDFDIFVSRSEDNGATWTAPAALNTNAGADFGGDTYPEVTTDGAGNWVAVWVSIENLGGVIGTDSDIFVSRSEDNGATWTAPAALNANAGSDMGWDYRPQVTSDGNGHYWVAMWQSNEDLNEKIGTDTDILVARSEDNGATWTQPVALNTNAWGDSGWDTNPQTTTDGSGNWVTVWGSEENLGGVIGTDFDIFVSRSEDNGATWMAPAALNANAGSDSGGDVYPQVTTDCAGNWVAVWQSNENLYGKIGREWDIFVARSEDNGATWTAPVALNTNAGSDSGVDCYPQITTGGAGNWVAVWESNENLGGTIGTDFDIFVSRSEDNGATWMAPAALNADAESDLGVDPHPQITTDGAGNWVTVWYSSKDLGGTIGTDYDIFVSLGQ